jgi:hypothetical protein
MFFSLYGCLLEEPPVSFYLLSLADTSDVYNEVPPCEEASEWLPLKDKH